MAPIAPGLSRMNHHAWAFCPQTLLRKHRHTSRVCRRRVADIQEMGTTNGGPRPGKDYEFFLKGIGSKLGTVYGKMEHRRGAGSEP